MKLRNKGLTNLTFIQYDNNNPLYKNTELGKKFVYYCNIDFFTHDKTDRMILSIQRYCKKNLIDISKIDIVRRPIMKTKNFDGYNTTIEIYL